MKKNKTIISWLGYRDDFRKQPDSKEVEVNPEGPNPAIHLHLFEYDRHVILHLKREESEMRADLLRTWLRSHGFQDRVQFHPVMLSEESLIDLERIQNKLTTLLMDYREDELYFYVTPGTKAMHTAWHIEHMNEAWDSHLIQIRPGQYTHDGKPELVPIDFKPSIGAFAAITSQKEQNAHSQETIRPSILEHAYHVAQRIAITDNVPALILGESGTGKEVMARFIHESSSRREKPFVAVNCSALPNDLLATELFGNEKGAFTGADQSRMGVFREASGGTILLDEIGDTSPKLQQSLLRVLQERKVRSVGQKEYEVDVRVIAATNKNLVKECSEGRFRWDLYYRLAVVEVTLPPLVDWGADGIDDLIDHFLEKKKSIKNGQKLKLTAKARKALSNYHFPGNVRELENLIARLYVLCEGAVEVEDLPNTVVNGTGKSPHELDQVISLAEEAHIRKILKLHLFNKEKSARVLGISPNTLANRIKKYGIKKTRL